MTGKHIASNLMTRIAMMVVDRIVDLVGRRGCDC